MRYFHLKLDDATTAQQTVWLRQRTSQTRRTTFGTSAIEGVASVWTQDVWGEQLFRQVLNELGIQYEESDQQQVVTPLDYLFKNEKGEV